MAHKTEEQVAKENRQRLFRDDGARAIEDAANEAIAVRKNMARLRELRLAKEAEAASSQPTKTETRKQSKKSPFQRDGTGTRRVTGLSLSVGG